jgi:hypothetical protein
MMKLSIFNNYCGYDDIFPKKKIKILKSSVVLSLSRGSKHQIFGRRPQ